MASRQYSLQYVIDTSSKKAAAIVSPSPRLITRRTWEQRVLLERVRVRRVPVERHLVPSGVRRRARGVVADVLFVEEDRVLFSVTGVAHGIELKLMENTLAFGNVVKDSRLTKTMQMSNFGDVKANFTWDAK